MNTDSINRWLTLGSNIGVMLGLILVAFQFQQSTDAIRLQARLGASGAIQSNELSVAGDSLAAAFAKSVLTPSELTPGEVTQVWSYLTAGMTGVYQNWVAYDVGYTTKQDMESLLRAATTYLNYPFGLMYWNAVGHDQYDPEFAALVDAALANLEPNSTQNSFQRLLDATSALSDAPKVH